MLFYEPLFLFIFFPTFYLLYLLGERGSAAAARHPVRQLRCSMYGATRSFPLVLVSSRADWVIAGRIARVRAGLALGQAAARVRRRRSISRMLLHFKYTHFLIDNLNSCCTAFPVGRWRARPSPCRSASPSSCSRRSPIWWTSTAGSAARRRNFFNYLTFVFFFPKLLAGPIIKYHEIEAQFAPARSQLDDFSAGFAALHARRGEEDHPRRHARARGRHDLRGRSARSASTRRGSASCSSPSRSISTFPPIPTWRSGIARMLGFRLLENFNMPYISCSMTEFWRRWHISLSTWIRDYLYIPLGGNRVTRRGATSTCGSASSPPACGTARRGPIWPGVPITACFSCSTSCSCCACWTGCRALSRTLFTFLVVVVGWTIFRAKSLEQAGAFFARCFSPAWLGQRRQRLDHARRHARRVPRGRHLRRAAPARLRAAAARRFERGRRPAVAIPDRDRAAVRDRGRQGGRRPLHAIPLFPVLTCGPARPHAAEASPMSPSRSARCCCSSRGSSCAGTSRVAQLIPELGSARTRPCGRDAGRRPTVSLCNPRRATTYQHSISRAVGVISPRVQARDPLEEPDLLLAARHGGHAGVVVGSSEQLYDRYLHEFCSRNAATYIPKAKDWAAKSARCRISSSARQDVLYVITPSKPAVYPKVVPADYSCRSSEQDRREKLPIWDGILDRAGVHYADTASLVAHARDAYPISMFPRGGVHWNRLAASLGAQAVTDAINRLRGSPLLTPFTISWERSFTPEQSDRDLLDILNLMYPDKHYEVPVVTIHSQPPADCNPTRITEVAGSFLFLLNDALAQAACPPEISNWFYWDMKHFRYPGGTSRPLPVDAAERRDALLRIWT